MAYFDVGADNPIIRLVNDTELLVRIKVMERIHMTEKEFRESGERYRIAIAIEYSNDDVAIIRGDQYLYVSPCFMKISASSARRRL